MENIARWLSHSVMSNPGPYADIIVELPSEVAALNRVIQGILIHSDWLSEYGLQGPQFDGVSRATKAVRDRLADILNTDSRSLEDRRPPTQRSIGTCRDFSLVLCSLLRTKGVAARLRCGFASYLSASWEDHWVCEYWDESHQTWRLSDPQIDEVIARFCRINFEPHDVPRSAFLYAGEAWSKYRSGQVDPAAFGHGSVTGPWFMMVNVFRDHYVLNGRETTNWDDWRSASVADRQVPEHYLTIVDDLAGRPDTGLVEMSPPWKS